MDLFTSVNLVQVERGEQGKENNHATKYKHSTN